MSTLKVNTVQHNTSGFNNVVQFTDGAGTQNGTLCRAWVNFNGSGTVAIRADFNVNTIGDNGTGDYTVNFSNAMADASYSIIGSASNLAGNSGISARQAVCPQDVVTARTSSACRIGTFYPGTDNAGSGDATQINVSIFR